MKKTDGPILLEDYVRKRKKRSCLIRSLCAAGLLLAAVLLRTVWPESAGTARAWMFGDGTINEAVAAFYAETADGAPLAEAVEAMCIALDGE